MTVDGSDDWNGGNALNPSGYAMPGVMSGDGTDDFLVTYIEGDGIYFGMTNSDLSNSDVLIYSTPVAAVPMSATTASVVHMTCHSAPTTCCGLTAKVPTTSTAWLLGWSPSSPSTANIDVDFSTSLAEFGVPWSRTVCHPRSTSWPSSKRKPRLTSRYPSRDLDRYPAEPVQVHDRRVDPRRPCHGTPSPKFGLQSYKGSTTATGQELRPDDQDARSPCLRLGHR